MASIGIPPEGVPIKMDAADPVGKAVLKAITVTGGAPS